MTMSRHCTTVFDIANTGYSAWPMVAIAAGVTVLLTLVFVIISRLRPLPLTAWIGPVIGGTVALGLFSSTWSEYRNALTVLKTGRYETVEGPIESFVAEPLTGHSEESFTVAGNRFHYGTYVMTPGFHLSRARGGPFAQGLYVRLRFRGNDILYAEVCDGE